MMSACVHGSLFASPGPATILAALRALGQGHTRELRYVCCVVNS